MELIDHDGNISLDFGSNDSSMTDFPGSSEEAKGNAKQKGKTVDSGKRRVVRFYTSISGAEKGQNGTILAPVSILYTTVLCISKYTIRYCQSTNSA